MVFISYRRDDSSYIAGRLRDRLAAELGSDEVFFDVDAIRPGVDFRARIEQMVSECDVVLVIIGPGWMSASDGSGRRRLELPDDFVRLEIEAALRRGIPVIPLLVDGAVMPQEVDLPEQLADLPYRQGMPLRRDPDFHPDVDRLLKRLPADDRESRAERNYHEEEWHELEIDQAIYGAQPRWEDVTTLVRSNVIGARLELTVMNSRLGGDPAPRTGKQLIIRYRYDGVPGRGSWDEGELAVLPPPSRVGVNCEELRARIVMANFRRNEVQIRNASASDVGRLRSEHELELEHLRTQVDSAAWAARAAGCDVDDLVGSEVGRGPDDAAV